MQQNPSPVTYLRFLLVGTFTALFAFGVFVWPTPYRYATWGEGNNSLPLRINRFTGRSWVLGTHQWVELTRPNRSTAQPAQLEPVPLDSIRLGLTLTDYGWIKGRIWNGSATTLQRIIVRGTAGSTDNGIPWSRVFELNVNVPPHSSADILHEMHDAGLHDVSWVIERALATGEVR